MTIAKQNISREELYKLVWAEPMLKVGAKFGVSSSYLARICAMLNVPRPERGYWAKLAVGKAPPVPALPEARPGDETHWTPGGGVTYVEPREPQIQKTVIAPETPAIRRRPKTHPLVVDSKPLFEAGTTSRDSEYLKPAKKLLVDLVVTQKSLDKALGFANELFCSLEAAGHHVVIAPHSEHFHRPEVDEREAPPRKNDGYRFDQPWRPFRITAVYIGTLAIGLTILELSENVEVRYVNGTYIRELDYVPPKRSSRFHDSTWTTRKDFPTRRLCLQAYSPYSLAAWSKQWREERQGRPLEVPAIVADLETAVPEIRRLLEEGKQRAEIEHQRWQAQMAEWKRQEEEKRVAKARKDSIDELLAIIGDWAGVKRLKSFFGDAAARLDELPPDERTRIGERLRLARELLGTTDSLQRFRSWKLPEER